MSLQDQQPLLHYMGRQEIRPEVNITLQAMLIFYRNLEEILREAHMSAYYEMSVELLSTRKTNANASS